MPIFLFFKGVSSDLFQEVGGTPCNQQPLHAWLNITELMDTFPYQTPAYSQNSVGK